jgi:hypothetical protein
MFYRGREQECIMSCRFALRFVAFLLLGLIHVAAGQAASVVDQVPKDALGFVAVHNLAQADTKIGNAFAALKFPIPAPLAVVKAASGIGAGLDTDRDALVVILPAENQSRPFHLALWLPVKDYASFVRSVDGDAERRTAAVTIAGEDLLVAHYKDWAVVMDPDQLRRLEQLESEAASSTSTAAQWASFVDAHDVTAVALRGGFQLLMAAAAPVPESEAAAKTPPSAGGLDNPFGGKNPAASSLAVMAAAFSSARELLEGVPEMKRLTSEAEGVGCGLRFDDAGNAKATFRAVLPADAAANTTAAAADTQRRSAPRLYDGDEFVMNGSGAASPRWTVSMVAPYVRQVGSDLASDYGVKVDDASLAAFRSLVEAPVGQAQAISLLTRPGGDNEGVYSNSFLAVRAASGGEFVNQAKAVVEAWNTMLGKAEGGAGLVFEEKAITIAGHDGTEYSIDMAKAVGAPPLPEARQSMEKLFGPGGRFRLQLLKVDDNTVLIAIATEEQLARPVQSLQSAKSAVAASDAKLSAVTALLGDESDWKLYFSIDGYNRWMKRQMEAVVGPVFGGPVVRPFPASPPIGAAGGATGNAMWAEVAVPADTLRGIGDFLHQ